MRKGEREGSGRTVGRTDGRTDRQTDRLTDRQTDKRDRGTDRRTKQQTDRQIGKPTDRQTETDESPSFLPIRTQSPGSHQPSPPILFFFHINCSNRYLFCAPSPPACHPFLLSPPSTPHRPPPTPFLHPSSCSLPSKFGRLADESFCF